tara:strand:- start:4800 stop:4979 length:180 start_codon:yes stop_codon:yes gene_type:complete
MIASKHMKQEELRRKWERCVKQTKEKKNMDPNSWKPRESGALTREILARFTAQMIKGGK